MSDLVQLTAATECSAGFVGGSVLATNVPSFYIKQACYNQKRTYAVSSYLLAVPQLSSQRTKPGLHAFGPQLATADCMSS